VLTIFKVLAASIAMAVAYTVVKVFSLLGRRSRAGVTSAAS
jgi:hypothetical protein